METIYIRHNWMLNSCNSAKIQEFTRLFAAYNIQLRISQLDLKEIDADSVTVVVHKASQVDDEVLVDDTSLHIDGANVGIHIRWLLSHLPNYVGCKADWKTLLAFKKERMIYVYKGIVRGSIVSPKIDSSFGFDAFFLPENSSATLSEKKPDEANARAIAVKSLMENNPVAIVPSITNWKGQWQY